MPFEDAYSPLVDILDNIAKAQNFVSEIDFEIFRDNALYSYATIRALEIISEASRRLPEDMKQNYPDIPWRDIAGSGNIFRHDYEDVLEKIVWDTVHTALAPLEAMVRTELQRLGKSSP